jgi:hypothetical protein
MQVMVCVFSLCSETVFYTCIWKRLEPVLSAALSYLGRHEFSSRPKTLVIPTDVPLGFSQHLKANSGIISYTTPRQFPSVYQFIIRYVPHYRQSY